MAARKRPLEVERLLTPAEVAELFKVNPLTVTRWAVQGRIGVVRTHLVQTGRGSAAARSGNAGTGATSRHGLDSLLRPTVVFLVRPLT